MDGEGGITRPDETFRGDGDVRYLGVVMVSQVYTNVRA